MATLDLIVIAMTILVGVATQLAIRRAFGFVVAFFAGVVVFGAGLFYAKNFIPYQGGGPSIWTMTLSFWGPIFGCIAAVAALLIALVRGDLRAMRKHGP